MKTENSTLAIDELPCGVLEISNERVILNCNTYAAKLFNQPVNKLIGLPIDAIVSPASRIFIDSYVYPLLLKDSMAREIQITIKDVDKQKVPIVANISTRDDHSSIWTFIQCENRDKLYEELLKARDSVKLQTDELSNLYIKIQSEHSNLQVFSHSLSHDFTAPIRQANQLISMAKEDLNSKNLDISEELHLLNLAQNSMGVLIKLINGLLDFISIEETENQNKTIPLNEIIDEAISLNTDYINNGATVERDDLPSVIGHSGQLNLLFKNLIGNGLKYNSDAGKVSITSDITSQKGHCIIKVKDNGIGISKEQLLNIFKPFVRLHTSNKYQGSGLGLSIVQKITEKHKGVISVESEPGNGTTFTITIPLATN